MNKIYSDPIEKAQALIDGVKKMKTDIFEHKKQRNDNFLYNIFLEI